MLCRLSITETAKKELHRLPSRTRDRMRNSVGALADDPRPRGCKELRGVDAYRVRVGDYRVIYDVDDHSQALTILRIKHRRGACRDL